MRAHASVLFTTVLVLLNPDPGLTSQKVPGNDCPADIVIGFLPLKTVSDLNSTEPAWPHETIRLISDNWESYVPIPPKRWNIFKSEYGTCYNVTYININLPRDEWVYNDIYNKQALDDLKLVDVVVGHYLPAVERYCKAHKKPYILSLPPTIALEERMEAEKRHERVMFSAWPSWKSFYELSARAWQMMRAEYAKDKECPIGRVFIIVEGPDPENVAKANELANILRLTDMKKGGAKAVFVETYDLTSEYKRSPYRKYSIEVFELLRIIHDHDVDTIVFMYKTANHLNILGNEFRYYKEAFPTLLSGSDDSAMWLLWDMTTDFNGVLSNLLNIQHYTAAKYMRLRSISLYNVHPFDLKCENITSDITEVVGANDGASMALLNAATTADMSFNSSMLLKSLNKFKVYLAGVKSRKLANWVNIYSGWSFKNGSRAFPAVYIGLAEPNATSVKADESASVMYGDRGSYTFSDCKPKLEYFLSRYWDKKRGRVVLHNEPMEVEEAKQQSAFVVDVVAVLEEPIIFSVGKRRGNKGEKYSGVAPEILERTFFRMSQQIGQIFSYNLYHTAGNEYGIYNKSTGNWSGALGEIQRKKASLAIGLFSKTVDRKRDFEFSPTYEFVGITFTMKKSREIPGYFAFMQPFKVNVWWGLLAVMLFSSLFVHLLDRWNPYMEVIDRDKRFHVNEGLWWSFGTITQAGGEFAPIMHATRVYSIFYWFFALVVTACYTGNLASFLVEQEQYLQAQAMDELPDVKGLSWGTLKGSYMEDYIRHANISHDFTELARGLTYIDSYKHGTEKASKGGYAFIGTNVLLEYFSAKDPDCSLALGSHVDSFTEIAFPMSRDWLFAKAFKKAMSSLLQDGTIRSIIQRRISKLTCEEAQDDDDDHIQLKFANFTGIYLLLVGFIGLSYIVLFFKLGALKLKERHEKLRREADKKDGRGDSEGIDIPMIEAKGNGPRLATEEDTTTI